MRDDIFDFEEQEVETADAGDSSDFFCREDLPYWMVEKYHRWDASERVRMCGHILPELPEVGGVK